MKKVIYLLVLCMVLGMAGCGTNQENKEPVSGNVSVETENKENDDVVQNEQIADTGSYPPCVMAVSYTHLINPVLYSQNCGMPLYCPMITYSSHTVDSSPEHLSAWHAWTTPDTIRQQNSAVLTIKNWINQ